MKTNCLLSIRVMWRSRNFRCLTWLWRFRQYFSIWPRTWWNLQAQLCFLKIQSDEELNIKFEYSNNNHMIWGLHAHHKLQCCQEFYIRIAGKRSGGIIFWQMQNKLKNKWEKWKFIKQQLFGRFYHPPNFFNFALNFEFFLTFASFIISNSLTKAQFFTIKLTFHFVTSLNKIVNSSSSSFPE